MKITLSGFLTWNLIFGILVYHPFSLECQGTLKTHVLVFFFLRVDNIFYTEVLGESGC